jgi:NADH-quinone oxidoreductase subunit J
MAVGDRILSAGGGDPDRRFCVVRPATRCTRVLFLILAFFSAAGLFVMLGAEFLAMLLVVVYVGAVAVLFLFVVMMLDIDFAALRQGFARYLPIGGLVAACWLRDDLISTAVAWQSRRGVERHADGRSPGVDVSNAEAIGRVLYTDYVYFFQAAGLVLLVAMIGAIVLTLRHKPGVRRQVIADQVARTPEDRHAHRPSSRAQGIDQ